MSGGLLPCAPAPVLPIGVASTEVLGIGFDRSCGHELRSVFSAGVAAPTSVPGLSSASHSAASVTSPVCTAQRPA